MWSLVSFQKILSRKSLPKVKTKSKEDKELQEWEVESTGGGLCTGRRLAVKCVNSINIKSIVTGNLELIIYFIKFLGELYTRKAALSLLWLFRGRVIIYKEDKRNDPTARKDDRVFKKTNITTK